MRDMLTPRDRGSIRDIPVPANHHRHPPAPADLREPQRPKRFGRRWLWPVIGVILLGVLGGVLLSTVLVGATITLYPKTQSVTTPVNLMAQPDAPAGQLGYQMVTLRQTATTTAAASGTSHVSRAASGLITIANAYSTASQTLVATTRFATADGSIYRIHTAVTVPGATKNADGSLTPGTVQATVYADQPGDSYNRPAGTSFTIPGFKGDPRYSAFSAQSAGPISGGLVGNEPTVSTADLTKAEATLKQSLDSQVQSALAGGVPSGFIVINGSLSTTYDDPVQSGSGTSVTITQSASASEAAVRSSDLAAAIATQAAQGYQGEPVDFADPSQVSVAVPSGSTPSGTLSITVSGTPTLVWQFDIAAIQQALAGKPKSSFQQIIQSFEPAVAGAQASVRPLWRATFPSDPGKITIKVSQSGQ